jgi:hypothetical protein
MDDVMDDIKLKWKNALFQLFDYPKKYVKNSNKRKYIIKVSDIKNKKYAYFWFQIRFKKIIEFHFINSFNNENLQNLIEEQLQLPQKNEYSTLDYYNENEIINIILKINNYDNYDLFKLHVHTSEEEAKKNLIYDKNKIKSSNTVFSYYISTPRKICYFLGRSIVNGKNTITENNQGRFTKAAKKY